MYGDELNKFLAGGDEIDYDKVKKDLTYLIYSTAKRLGRVLDQDSVSDLVSRFFLDLWAVRDQFPLQPGFCFGHAKRLVYSLSSRGNCFVDLDSVLPILAVPEKSEPLPERTKEDFSDALDDLPVHRRIKLYYKRLIKKAPLDDLYAISRTDTFLGGLLLAALLKKQTTGPQSSDFRDMMPMSPREEEVMLACTIVKIPRKWVIPGYILMREGLFVSLLSFMNNLLAPALGTYFKNLYSSVRIYCLVEKAKKGVAQRDAIKYCGDRFLIRVRDVENRYNRIGRLLKSYGRYAKFFASQINRDYASFCRSRHVQQAHRGSVPTGGEGQPPQ